uniref:Uncharacterized protein n=1 Tax=Noccaea caerulescens TaxID=107243 RepID=A0A1J3D4Q3_NOCCA
MAERKLNLNAPLLSTRRMHKTAVSVRRFKTHKFTSDDDSCSSSVQVLVPEIGLDQVTESASVPFTWEQAPGRLKENDLRPQQVCESKQQVFTPCLPPGKVKAIDGNMTKFQSKHVEEESEEDEEDDVFSDARDTLNHSVSGYGGVVTKKKPLTLSEDSLSRDFMLNRFLPAAKAMTVEQPHYASNRKPSTFMSEPTIQVREFVSEERRPTPNRYHESAIVPYYHYHQDIDDDDEEGEDEEENDRDDQVSVHEYAYLSKRGCGMLPQLMMNTLVPGFKAKHNSPVTSPSHAQVKSSKASQLKSKFQSAKKLALYSVSKHKLGGKVQSPVHENVGKKLNSESNMSVVASRSSSPYRHSRCMSPFRSNGNSFAETRKETENLRANRLNRHIRNISTSQELLYPKTSNGSTSSLLEKTVYVDTESFPMTNDAIISTEEEDKAEEKPDASLALVAFENMSMVDGDGDDELGKINNGPDQSRLAPPSPRKPSESWLLHNLPSVNSHNIPSRRYHPFLPQKKDPREHSRNVVTKWETIVKTSYMHTDHFRYSEELVAHTSHQ